MKKDKFTNLFDYDFTEKNKKLIYVQLQSLKYYSPIIKKLEKDYRVKQFFNTDLSHIQLYLFTKLRIEPTSKVKVEYNGSKLLEITKIEDEEEVSPPPFSLLYFDLHTHSGILASDDAVKLIKVRYEDFEKNEREDLLFQDSEENTILQDFSDYVTSKDPDIVVCMGDYDNRVLQYLFARTSKIRFNLQLGRETVGDEGIDTQKGSQGWIKGRISISSSYRNSTFFDQFGFAGLIERARFGFLPLAIAAIYGINRLIDSRNCYELIHRGFVIPKSKSGTSNNNPDYIRTVEQIVSRDKGSMIISPQIGLHENVVSLDYESEYANLIVNHNLSYETITEDR